jgi:hypothetical protein
MFDPMRAKFLTLKLEPNSACPSREVLPAVFNKPQILMELPKRPTDRIDNELPQAVPPKTDKYEPISPKLLTDNEEAKLMWSSADNRSPVRTLPKMLTPDAQRAKERTLKAEPPIAKVNTETWLPHLANERTDILLPACMKLHTEACPATLVLPNTLNPLPILAKLRIDKDDPACAKSRTDNADPNFTKERAESDDAISTTPITDVLQSEPNLTIEATDNAEPSLTIDRTDNELPPCTKFRTETELPSLANERTLKVEPKA